jgi:hypothetical protein
MSGIGKLTVKTAGKVAGKAAGAVTDMMGQSAFPESEHALAAYLYERILQDEKDSGIRQDRSYHLKLMAECLAAVRGG